MIDFIKKLVLDASNEFYKTRRVITSNKQGGGNWVTETDLAIEKYILNSIRKNYPDDLILSEETAVKIPKNPNTLWIIDPLDGTNNFKNSIPIYSVIVGLAKQNQNKELEMIAGAVYIPALNELYQASMGNGAFLNDKRIVCSPKEDLVNAVGAGHFENWFKYEKQVKAFFESSKELKHYLFEYGTGGYDMTLVARGSRDFYFMPPHGGGIWDNAGPYIILKEAGCKVVNFRRENWSLKDNTEMIAGNPKIVDHIFDVIGK